MKRVKIGIMSLPNFQAYTRDIVTGKYKRKRGEPKIWFSSMGWQGSRIARSPI